MNNRELQIEILKQVDLKHRSSPKNNYGPLKPLDIEIPGTEKEQISEALSRLKDKGQIYLVGTVGKGPESEIWKPTHVLDKGLNRLDRILDSSSRTVRTQARRPTGPKLKRFPTPPGTKWKEVVFRFISLTEIEIRVGKKVCRFRFDEIGFQDRRHKKKVPTVLWRILSSLAANEGELSWQDLDRELPTTKTNAREAVFRRIRHLLKKMMGIKENPILKDRAIGGYRAKFAAWHEMRRTGLQKSKQESISEDVQQLIDEETQSHVGRRSFKPPHF